MRATEHPIVEEQLDVQASAQAPHDARCVEGGTELRRGVDGVAEEAGFESVWTGEHVVLPDPQQPPSPAAPETKMLDPATALAFVAAHTDSIRLGTGIVILPQRNPLVLAKETASVDVLSGGRLMLGSLSRLRTIARHR